MEFNGEKKCELINVAAIVSFTREIGGMDWFTTIL